MAPARWSSASASVVLPAPPWPDQGHVADLLGREALHSAPPRGRQLRVKGQGSQGPYAALVGPSTLRLPDGRTLAYDDVGDPAGPPVVYLHGTPDSRLGRPADAVTRGGRRAAPRRRPARASGDSDLAPGADAGLARATTCARLLDRPRAWTACLLVGWSGGGLAALGGRAPRSASGWRRSG